MLQIDYIDEDGNANYIDTFKNNELNKAIRIVNYLNFANSCINSDTYYVLDKYNARYDEPEPIQYNLTNAQSINDKLGKLD